MMELHGKFGILKLNSVQDHGVMKGFKNPFGSGGASGQLHHLVLLRQKIGMSTLLRGT